MRVDKIGINTRVNINNKNQNDSNKIKSNLQTKNVTDLNRFQNNQSLAFSGMREIKNKRVYNSIKELYTPETRDIMDLAKKTAIKTNSPHIETRHIYYAILLELKKYIDAIDKGAIKPSDNIRYKTPETIQALMPATCPNLFEDARSRAMIKDVINNHIKQAQELFFTQNKTSNKKRLYPLGIQLSQNAMEDIIESYQLLLSSANSDNSSIPEGIYFDSFLYSCMGYTKDRKLSKEFLEFNYDIMKTLSLEETKKDKNHLSFYDNEADLMWKNISAGKNVALLCDDNNYEQLKHLKNSFVNLINKPDQTYDNINPEKTDIYLFNQFSSFSLLEELTEKCLQQKDRLSVIVFDFRTLIKNNPTGNMLDWSYVSLLANNKKDSNVKYVMTIQPELYYENTKKNQTLRSGFLSYADQTLPSLNSQDAIQYLTDKKGINYIKSIVKKDIDTQAVKKAIEVSKNNDGIYPDKAIKIIEAASLLDSQSDKITEGLIDNYIQNAKKLSKTTSKDSDSSNKIIFDTGKNLSDIVGTPMTKADAQNVVSQIKNGTFKTKGYTIYHANGSSYGGGRKNTALAIAGETGIPVIIINAKDFALKDIDTLSQNADFSEMKIKKIISNAKAQAQASPNNTVMLYIENFDNFASNPLYGVSSIYEQKAFSQLLDEMENLRKDDSANLLIIGSMNMPELLDENILKPNRFLNSIVVYPPQKVEERKEVIDYYINKMDLQIKGDTQEEKNKVIDTIAQTTRGFSVVDIIYMLENAKDVMTQRGKDAIDKSDFIEAYLQTTTGRSSGSDLNEHGKNIVTSHELGHALCIQIMDETAKKYFKNWQQPDEVNFISLDPRSWYGGVVYSKDSDNQETTFETIMANLVFTYGGNSAEKIIYGIDGSYGITADMEQAAYSANMAVLDMGMGPKTGVRHIPKNALNSADVSREKKLMIEQDVDSMLMGAKYISDRIIEEYKPFVLEFTKRHSKDVGSGECLILGEDFIQELNEWRNKQDDKTKERLSNLEKEIVDTLNKVKNNK